MTSRLATSLAIALERLVPYLSEEIAGMFDSYRVRKEENELRFRNDGTTATPYKERVVFGADGEGQLVLCDMKGLRNVMEEGRLDLSRSLARSRRPARLH